jgi:ribosomal protein S18 acetylase RimI-like enzyme
MEHIKIKKISFTSLDDLILLEEFIKNNPKGQIKFRYFENRKYDVIKNHLYTALYYLNEEIVGYGHLDFEHEKTWLGIMVSDNFTSKGIGKFIIDDLINHSNGDIYLSVDSDNTNAIHLYKKKNFNIISSNNKHHIMKKWQIP